ncbi:MAG: 16S rRNA (cytidine(1402)-2'-O)-methyltransferase [Pseudomonadota bacterium]
MDERSTSGASDGPTARLAPGLYLVATPIGNARDITLRALDALAGADILAAEDTRTTRRLLEIHGIKRASSSLWPYHEHNGPQQRPRILEALAAGQSVALASDAGTPLISDPGYPLVRAAIAAGLAVYPLPGPSAPLAALALSGLPTDRFFFAGFLPPKSAARAKALMDLAQVPATLIFFEAPRRLAACLTSMAETLGGRRDAAVCREITKRFEEARRGTLAELASAYAAESDPKGEIVIVIGPPLPQDVSETAIDARLREALANGSVKDAAQLVAAELGLPRRQVYARALALDSEA